MVAKASAYFHSQMFWKAITWSSASQWKTLHCERFLIRVPDWYRSTTLNIFWIQSAEVYNTRMWGLIKYISSVSICVCEIFMDISTIHVAYTFCHISGEVMSWPLVLLFPLPALFWNRALVCLVLRLSVPPLCVFPSSQWFSIPSLTCPAPASLHLFLVLSLVCLCTSSLSPLMSCLVPCTLCSFHGRLCSCPVFPSCVSSCLALACSWYLFLLSFIDLYFFLYCTLFEAFLCYFLCCSLWLVFGFSWSFFLGGGISTLINKVCLLLPLFLPHTIIGLDMYGDTHCVSLVVIKKIILYHIVPYHI